MPVTLGEYLGVVLMKFEEELRLKSYSERERLRLYGMLQDAMKKADEWKKIADPLIRS